MKEALKLALEELAVRFSEGWHEGIKIDASDIMLLNEAAQALAQPAVALEQEPVAFELYHHIVLKLAEAGCKLSEQQKMVLCNLKAVTTPPQRTWVGLTDEDRQAAFESMPDMLDGFLKKWGWLHFSKALEAKLKEKNT